MSADGFWIWLALIISNMMGAAAGYLIRMLHEARIEGPTDEH